MEPSTSEPSGGNAEKTGKVVSSPSEMLIRLQITGPLSRNCSWIWQFPAA